MHPSSPHMPPASKRYARSLPRPLLIAAAVLSLLQGCASNPPAPPPGEAAHAEAKAAYLASDYQRTLAIVEPLAIGGEAWAQYTLGYMYYYGRGVAIDRQMAKLWIQRAAQQDYGPAKQALQRLSVSEPRRNNGEEMEAPSGTAPATPPARAPMPVPPASSGPSSATPAPSPGTPPGEAPMPMPPPATANSAPRPTEPPQDKVPPPEPTPPPSPGAATTPPQDNANPMGDAPTSPPGAAPAPTTPAPGTAPPAEHSNPPPAAAMPMSEPAPAPSAGPMPAAMAAPADGEPVSGIKGAVWIGAQNPQHYTLQLLGATNEAAVVRFIRDHHLEREAAYFAQKRDAKPWYTIIYGSFTDRQSARQALGRLPAAVNRASPWIRSFKDIQTRLGP